MAEKRRSWLEQTFINWNTALRDRSDTYLARRPHRSFRRTYRRDYTRSFKLPGYIGLTTETATFIGRNWRLYGAFCILYAVASAIILGVINQTNYSSLTTTLKSATPDVWLRTFAIFGTAITGGLNSASTSNGQVFSVILVVIAWLTLVWLIRHRMGGAPVKLREGLYSGSAPLVSTVLVALVGAIQCIPLLLVAVGYSAASGTGVLANGVEAMLFYGAALLLALLSIYWLASTFIALIIVTLPGMYPMAALRAAGDLIVGRRLRLILRLLWMVAAILIVWALILIPIILLDGALSIAWLPLVPVFVLLLTTLTLVIASTYIYLLYRKLVDDDAKPA